MKQVAPYKKDQKDHEKHESIWLEDDLKLTSLTNKLHRCSDIEKKRITTDYENKYF